MEQDIFLPEVHIRGQILQRRQRLQTALTVGPDARLSALLQEVDAALGRMDDGNYGVCVGCQHPLEEERLNVDPLVEFCLSCLSPEKQRALERDLELASRIQRGLLPPSELNSGNWTASFHYEPAGVVSGDYCDLFRTPGGSLYFMLGDVSGKGVAASMLMVHLHAIFRTLLSVQPPLAQLVEEASRVFCESTLPNQFATLVCGRAEPGGRVEICNAGHLPPVVVSDGEITALPSTGLPLGMFCEEKFSVSEVVLRPRDHLMIYTDGLTEARDAADCEYGFERLADLLRKRPSSPAELITWCRRDLDDFRLTSPAHDDLTLLALQHV